MVDKELVDFIGDVRESMGRVETGQKNTLEFLKAVNENQKETRVKLDTHIQSTDAHGAKSRKEVWLFMGKMIATISTISGITYVVLRIAGKVGG